MFVGHNMPIGIEIASDVMRCSGSGEKNNFSQTDYGIIGVIPRTKEPFIWNNPYALRNSSPGPYISLTDAWIELQNKSKEMLKHNQYMPAKCRWQQPDGFADERLATDLIIDAISQNIPQSRTDKTIFAIENTLHEFQQESLLKSLCSGGFVDIELLWRPVCIALHYLKLKDRTYFNENNRLVIVDLDSYLPEITVLKLKKYNNEFVPLRNLPSRQKAFNVPYSDYMVKRGFIKHITKNQPGVDSQLVNGPNAGQFFSFLESKKYNDLWLRNGLSYYKYQLNDNWHREIRDYSVNDINFVELREKILNFEDWKDTDHIVWNGFLSRIQPSNLFSEHEIVMDELAVCSGAADYAARRQEGRPTYLDTIPELEILSSIEGTKKHDFFQLIEEDEIEGGSIKRTPKPRTEFKLEKNTIQFTAVLRIDKDKCKKLVTDLDIQPNPENIPLLIKAEQRPANGHAIVTIEGNKENQDVFGRRGFIELNWKSMEDFEFDTKPIIPDFYPIRGRIVDDVECLEVARFVVNNNLNLGSNVTYRNHLVRYAKIHEPWGYEWPFGIFLGQTQRALFGAQLEDNAEIQKLSDGIGKMIQTTVVGTRNRHKYLNYMFRYAPDYFLDELREQYKLPNPNLNMNTVFAVGRTFYRQKDFELFLHFFLQISESLGYPYYKNDYYTKAFFWSFFRALCYYEDTVNVPRELIENVLHCIYNYSLEMFNQNWPIGRTANEIKYLLCGILFSLRLRKIHIDFLLIDSDLYFKMVKVIREFIPNIAYPRYMFAEPQNDFLNDYVYRFLSNMATEQDYSALQGLVVAV